MRDGGRAHRRLRRRRAGQPRARPAARRAPRRARRRPDAPPFFGRTDRDRDRRRRTAEVFHIGRRHVRDDDGDPVVIDWRAPIARGVLPGHAPTTGWACGCAAASASPAGVLTSFEDEHLDRGEALGLDVRPAARGDRAPARRADARHRRHHPARPGRAGARRPRHLAVHPGRARAPARPRSACTARPTCSTPIPSGCAAPACWSSGPNRAFLHYIAQVLPSLGEGGISRARSTTCSATRPRGDRAGRRSPCSRATPGMADVAAPRGARPTSPSRPRTSSRSSAPSATASARTTCAATSTTPAARSTTACAGRSPASGCARRSPRTSAASARTPAARRPTPRPPGSPARRRCASGVDAVWPALSAPALLARLYDDADFLRRCSAPTLTDDERALLHRPAPRSVRAVRWTPADAVLLDELDAACCDGTDTFVHVGRRRGAGPVGDAVPGRRPPLPARLGDRARRPGPGHHAVGAGRLGGARCSHLGHDGAEVRPLTAGYRVPGRGARAGQPAAAAHRRGRRRRRRRSAQGADALRFAGAATLVDRGARLPGRRGLGRRDRPRRRGGRACSPSCGRRPGCRSRSTTTPTRASRSSRPSTAKGLEFDSVVLVEPAAIVAGRSRPGSPGCAGSTSCSPGRPAGRRRLGGRPRAGADDDAGLARAELRYRDRARPVDGPASSECSLPSGGRRHAVPSDGAITDMVGTPG